MKSADEETCRKYKNSAERGASQEELIAALSDEGYPITEAIKVIRATFCISLGEAKIAVSKHSSWENAVERSQDLHDDFEDVFNS